MKKTFLKIVGVVGTVALLAALFVTAAPVSADVQAWSKVTLPSATNLVMPNDITMSGPLAKADDGTLYTCIAESVYSPSSTVYEIVKSIDGGRTWKVTGTIGQPTAPVVDIATLPGAAGTVYYVTGTNIFKSVDAGANFLQVGASASGTITSLAVATYSPGRIVDIVGVTGGAAAVYYIDESLFFNTVALGTPNLVGNALDVAMSPNFATDRGVAALLTTGVVSYDEFGGAWGANMGNLTLPAAVTAGTISFPSDYNVTSNPNFFVGVAGGGTGNAGVWQVRGIIGGVGPSIGIQLTSVAIMGSTAGAINVTSMDVNGTFAAANIIVGTSADKVWYTTNGGSSWSSPTKGPSTLLASTATTGKTFVKFKTDFATSGVAYVLVAANGAMGVLGVNDETGFSYSADKMVSFNGISLLNSAIAQINDMAISGSTQFLATTGNAGTIVTAVTAGSVTIKTGTHVITGNTYAGASSVTFTSAAAGTLVVVVSTGDTLSYTFGGPAGAFATGNLITFTAAGQTAKIQCTTTPNATLSVGASTATVVASVTAANGAVLGGGFGNLSFSAFLPYFAAGGAAPDTVGVNTTVTLSGLPTTGWSASWTGSTAISTTATSVQAVFSAVGDTFTFSNTGTAVVNGTAIYTTGAGDTAPTQIATLAAGSTFVTPLTLTGDAFSLAAAVTASNTTRDSIWRFDGTNWERVQNVAEGVTTGGNTIPIITSLRASPAYATDGTVFYTALYTLGADGKVPAIVYTNNKGQTWKAQTTAPGASILPLLPMVTSWMVIDANTILVGSPPPAGYTSGIITKTSSNGVIWQNDAVISTAVAFGTVTDFDMSTDGTTILTGGTAGYTATSTDGGVTWTVTNPLAPLTTFGGNMYVNFQQGSNTIFYVDSDTPAGAPSGNSSVTLTCTFPGVEIVSVNGSVAYSTTGGANVFGNKIFFTTIGQTATITATSPNTMISLQPYEEYLGGTTIYPNHISTTLGIANGATYLYSGFPNYIYNATLPTGPSATYVAPVVYRWNPSLTTPAFEKVNNDGAPNVLDSAAHATGYANGHLVRGIASGTGNVVNYVFNSDNVVDRIASQSSAKAINTYAGKIAGPTGATCAGRAYAMWIAPAQGANVLYALFISPTGAPAIYTYTDVLAVPLVVTVTGNTTSSFTVNWTANAAATGYQVFVTTDSTALVNPYVPSLATAAAATQVFPLTVGVNATSATITGLAADTAYQVSVWANGPVTSFVGTAAAKTVTPAPSNPGANLAPTSGAINVSVNTPFSWNAIAGATKYHIQVSTDPNFAAGKDVVSADTVNPYYALSASLQPNTVYYWRVNATTANSTSAWVTSDFTTAPAAIPPVTITQTQTQPPNITLVVPTQETTTPSYIWAIIIVGAILTIAVIVLIVRTRRVV